MNIVQTHDGVFHADESMAAAILKSRPLITKIIRSRVIDPTAGVVFDVGGVNDGKTFFDHHQRGGAGERPNGIPYAAAGLVWRKFGPDLVLLYTTNPEWIADVVERVDAKLIQPIDAADTGYLRGKLDPVKELPLLSFSHAISMLNDNPTGFEMAVHICVEVLEGAVRGALEWVSGRASCRMHLNVQIRNDDSILELPKFIPGWQEHLLSLSGNECAKFLVYPDEKGADTTWMVQQIPLHAESFEGRLQLPESWAGLRDGVLKEKTGVADAVFCHPGRFICGARTRTGALALANLALAK